MNWMNEHIMHNFNDELDNYEHNGHVLTRHGDVTHIWTCTRCGLETASIYKNTSLIRTISCDDMIVEKLLDE